MTVYATLTYILKGNNVLLIRKKRGFGVGKFNAPGGKINDNENVYDAAKREVFEEIGLIIEDIEPVGILIFYSSSVEPDWVVYVFKTTSFKGNPRETDEALPLWFSLREIPLLEMWVDDWIWIPYFFNDTYFRAFFKYDNEYKKMINWRVEKINIYLLKELIENKSY